MLATVASISGAGRLKKYLAEEYRISSKIIQTPSSLTKEGCGYSLRFEDSKKQLVADAAGKLKINIRSFFSETASNGSIIYKKEE
jgi:hypothetical protein